MRHRHRLAHRISTDVDAVLAFAASGEPAAGLPEIGRFVQNPQAVAPAKSAAREPGAAPIVSPPEPLRLAKDTVQTVDASGGSAKRRGRPHVAERVHVLVLEQLRQGPKPDAARQLATLIRSVSTAVLARLDDRPDRGPNPPFRASSYSN